MPRNRNLRASIVRALREPAYARRQVHRVSRDVRLRLKHRGDHVAYYRAVMQDAIARGETTAVATDRSSARWRKRGRRQFDYLVANGLLPEHRVLDIGCGNLRAGRRFISYLDPGNYWGIDISPDSIAGAHEVVRDEGLTDKAPHLLVVSNLSFDFADGAFFDVVHANSVFSHSPLSVVEECFAHIGRVLKPTGFFDFTFNRTEGRERSTLGEDYYYRPATLIDAAQRHRLRAEFLDDWEALRPIQSKIRVTRMS
jgi:SAM-dependent methyltransferase